jgi:hypothetical protein
MSSIDEGMQIFVTISQSNSNCNRRTGNSSPPAEMEARGKEKFPVAVLAH